MILGMRMHEYDHADTATANTSFFPSAASVHKVDGLMQPRWADAADGLMQPRKLLIKGIYACGDV